MPGTRCAVASCNNSFIMTKKSGQSVRYFTFPKEEKIKEIWVHRCGREGSWNPETSKMCSIHFTEHDYKRDLQAELLGTKPKIVLKKSAVPSLFLKAAYSVGEIRVKC